MAGTRADFLPADFETFLLPDCDRCHFIIDRLADRGIDCSIIEIETSRHIFVRFSPDAYTPQFRMKTVLVHYDRVENSPGANDNSAAVFQVMDWAERLAAKKGPHNVRIFFSDGEEMGGSSGVSSQGAFGIAAKFRSLGIMNDDVYVFDCCGRGSVAVLSQAGTGAGSGLFRQRFNDLIRRTENLLREVSPGKWMTLPVPYSDNAGFLACGIPAVAITLLPAEEATLYLRNLYQTRGLEQAIMKNSEAAAQKAGLELYQVKEKQPVTWRLLHTEYDNILSLTPESFPLMARLLDTLAALKTPV